MRTYFKAVVKELSRAIEPGTAALLILVLLWPEMAWADGTGTLGNLIQSVCMNIDTPGSGTSVADLFNAVAYISGAVFIGNSAYLFVKHSEKPDQVGLHQPIARAMGGSGLIALPSMISWLMTTLGVTTSSGNGVRTCLSPDPAAGGSVDGSTFITSFVGSIRSPMISLLSVVATTIGILYIIRGLMKAAKYGTDPRAYSMPNILANLVAGTALTTVGASLTAIMATVFSGDGSIHVADVASWVAVQNLGASTSFINAITAALTFFQLIGLISFIRGWMIVKSAVEGSGQATIAQGFTHIVGGVLAINIYYFLEIMDSTFGTGMLVGS